MSIKESSKTAPATEVRHTEFREKLQAKRTALMPFGIAPETTGDVANVNASDRGLSSSPSEQVHWDLAPVSEGLPRLPHGFTWAIPCLGSSLSRLILASLLEGTYSGPVLPEWSSVHWPRNTCQHSV